MKRGFRGLSRPLFPAMLPVVDQSVGPADQAEDQPSSFEPLPSTSHPTPIAEPTPVPEPTTHPTSPSSEPDNEPTEHTFDQPSTEHQPLSPRKEPKVPQSQYPSHPHVPEARSLTFEDLLYMVPTLITKVDSLEREAQATKQTMESHCDGPTTLEAAKTLSLVLIPRSKFQLIKGKRYKRRKEFKGKDFEDISTGFKEVNTGGLTKRKKEPVKKMGKRRKHIVRKGLHTTKDEAEKDKASEEDDSSSGLYELESPMLKEISREDLYKNYSQRHMGREGPNRGLEKGVWENLKTNSARSDVQP
ncbi:hypothetical protein Tco_0204217 [Tanacetum coccineum]